MIKLPEKYYVGIRAQAESESKLPLGFATPFGTDAAFTKRKATVDKWTGKADAKKKDQPRFETLDNVLMEGFRISQSVRRYGWNGGGNVLWRIEDPRGFELEISSSNFASIVDCTTLTAGVIEGKCIWGREGSTNVLLPEASTPYQEAVNFTKLSTLSVSSKDMKPGQFVRMKDDTLAMYCGEFFGLVTVSEREGRPGIEVPQESRWNTWNRTIPQPPFIKLTTLNRTKRALYLKAEAAEQFLKDGTLPLYHRSPEYFGYADCFFSYSGFKTVAKLENRKEVIDQAKIIALIENSTAQTFCPLFQCAVSIVSTEKFKAVEFKVVEEELLDRKTGCFIQNPKGELFYVYYHNFHDNRYSNYKGTDKDEVTLQLMSVDINDFKLDVELKSIREDMTLKAMDPKILDGWKAVTVYVTANGRTAPLRISSHHSTKQKSIFYVEPTKRH